eukprot:gene4018-7274_t
MRLKICALLLFVCIVLTNSIKLYPSEKVIHGSGYLYIAKSKIPNSGKGVFTKRTLKENQLVEECPLLLVEKSVMKTKLADYVFLPKYQDKKKYNVLALGFCSMYNHHDNANVYRR